MTLIGVHKKHATNIMKLICLPMTPLSSLGYPMITYTHPVASSLSIKKLWLLDDYKQNVIHVRTCRYLVSD